MELQVIDHTLGISKLDLLFGYVFIEEPVCYFKERRVIDVTPRVLLKDKVTITDVIFLEYE